MTSNATPGPKKKKEEEIIEPVPLENIMELSSQSSIWAMMGEINLNGTFQDSFDHMMKSNLSLQTIPVPGENKDLISYLGASMSESPAPDVNGLTSEFDAEITQTESFSIDDSQQSHDETNEAQNEETVDTTTSFTTSASFDDSKLSSQFVEVSMNNSTLISNNTTVGNLDDESKCDEVCTSIDVYSSDFESMSPITPSSRASRKSELKALQRRAYIHNLGKTAEIYTTARGHSPNSVHGSSPMSPSSLMERNKTLVKEVRFADQTCVELGQKNVVLEKEIQRLRSKLNKARKENGSMHEAVVQSATHGAASDSKIDVLSNKITEQQERYELQLSNASNSIDEYKRQVNFLTEQMEWHKKERTTLEDKLTASNEQQKKNISELMESKDVITKLMERLMVNNTDPKAASFYREDSLEASMDVVSVKDMYEKQLASYLVDDCESRGMKGHNSLSNDALLLALDNGMSEIRKLKATIHVLEEEIEQKDIEAKKMHDDEDKNWKHKEAQMKDEIEQQLNQIQHLSHQKEDMNSQLIRQDEEIRNLSHKVSHLSSDLSQRDDKLDTLQMKHADLVHKLKSDFEEEKIHYTEKLKEVQVSNEVCLSKLNDRDQFIENMKRDMNYLQDKEEKSKATISSLETEIKQKTAESNKHAKKIDSYQRKCSLLKDKIGTLTTKCDEYTVNYRNLSKDLSAMKKAKTDALNQLSEYMSQFKSKSCNANGEYIFCEECKHLRRAISTEGKRNATLRDELDKKETEISKLRRMLKKISTDDTKHTQGKKVSKGSSRFKSVEVIKDHKRQVLKTSDIENSTDNDLYQDVV